MQRVEARSEWLTIQQMVELTGLSAYTLRYYERAGLMRTGIERGQSNGHRHYTQQDVNWIEFIKRLRSTGMPIRDIHRYTVLMSSEEDTLGSRLQLLKQHRQRVEGHMQEVELHLAAINKKITLYEAQRYNQQVQDACLNLGQE